MRIELTCTDRQGRRIASKIIDGPSKYVNAERAITQRAWLIMHADYDGITPYIFCNLRDANEGYTQNKRERF
jgi:hypothetical protein